MRIIQIKTTGVSQEGTESLCTVLGLAITAIKDNVNIVQPVWSGSEDMFYIACTGDLPIDTLTKFITTWTSGVSIKEVTLAETARFWQVREPNKKPYLIATTPFEPFYRGAIIDRYLLAARVMGYFRNETQYYTDPEIKQYTSVIPIDLGDVEEFLLKNPDHGMDIIPLPFNRCDDINWPRSAKVSISLSDLVQTLRMSKEQ